MTADERIEKLLNAFGQTIEDLPKRYSATSQASARKEAAKFDLQTRRVVSISPESSYICHLADVIDRMEIALETAYRWMPCDVCDEGYTDEYYADTCGCYKDGRFCGYGFRLPDRLLHDVDEHTLK